MPTTDPQATLKTIADISSAERLQKDITAVKDDIAALTDQITDALNTFAGAARRQARQGYRQARGSMDATMDDMSERGGAMIDAAQEAAASLEERLEDAIAQRPLATVGLALGLGFLIGAAWRR